jgi:hypothetical protein
MAKPAAAFQHCRKGGRQRLNGASKKREKNVNATSRRLARISEAFVTFL